MYDIFERNDTSEQIDVKSDSARRLLLNIVNSLSSKMEIGSPMASMYLLGNPDHYTSHKFIPFWWKSYVNNIEIYWNSVAEAHKNSKKFGEPMDIDESNNNVENLDTLDDAILEEKVVIGRHEGQYVGSSNVDDYKYRPQIYNSISLFEWIQTAVRRKCTKKELEKMTHSNKTVPPDTFTNRNSTENDTYINDVNLEESENEDLKDSNADHTRKYTQFLPGHPLSATHVVKCDFEKTETMVPNFVGGPLPRHDQGDREYYCCTMLTLFKPWRTGRDLKTEGQTWNDGFEIYEFSDQHKNLMKNFNLRYECLDARDDFRAELRSKEAKSRKRVPQSFDDEFEENNNDEFVHHILNDEDEDFKMPSPAYEHEINLRREADAIMRSSGWLNKPSLIKKHSEERFSPKVGLPYTAWAARVKTERDRIFKDKLSGYIPPKENINGSSATQTEDVRILSADYLLRTYQAKKVEHQNIVEETIHKFSLNEEQECAFRIVGNHASSLAPEPLRIYLGGMGGTGKSRVIKAITHMFNERKESHRFIVLAPTGTAAVLLNGSTYHRALGLRP